MDGWILSLYSSNFALLRIFPKDGLPLHLPRRRSINKSDFPDFRFTLQASGLFDDRVFDQRTINEPKDGGREKMKKITSHLCQETFRQIPSGAFLISKYHRATSFTEYINKLWRVASSIHHNLFFSVHTQLPTEGKARKSKGIGGSKHKEKRQKKLVFRKKMKRGRKLTAGLLLLLLVWDSIE